MFSVKFKKMYNKIKRSWQERATVGWLPRELSRQFLASTLSWSRTAFCTVANPALRWHLICECHTGHAPMAKSSQSRALSREGSSSETRRPKPANSCPQELGYKPALPGPARRGFGSLFLCQSSVVKIIALVLKKRETFCACGLWLVSASVAFTGLVRCIDRTTSPWSVWMDGLYQTVKIPTSTCHVALVLGP